MADISGRNYNRGSVVQPVVLVDPTTGADYIAGGGGSNPSGDGAANTGTQTSVNSSTSDATILAANTARYGATIYNDDANILYLLLGAGTASSTNYSVALYSGDFFPVPYGYTGIIKGIWSADGSGAARVTEFT